MIMKTIGKYKIVIFFRISEIQAYSKALAFQPISETMKIF